MGNAVDVERAKKKKKKLAVEELVWSSFEDKVPEVPAHVQLFCWMFSFAEYTEETRLTMGLREQVAWFV